MHEVVTMVSGWLVSYLMRSAVAMAVIGAVAWLGDWLLRSGAAGTAPHVGRGIAGGRVTAAAASCHVEPLFRPCGYGRAVEPGRLHIT